MNKWLGVKVEFFLNNSMQCVFQKNYCGKLITPFDHFFSSNINPRKYGTFWKNNIFKIILIQSTLFVRFYYEMRLLIYICKWSFYFQYTCYGNIQCRNYWKHINKSKGKLWKFKNYCYLQYYWIVQLWTAMQLNKIYAKLQRVDLRNIIHLKILKNRWNESRYMKPHIAAFAFKNFMKFPTENKTYSWLIKGELKNFQLILAIDLIIVHNFHFVSHIFNIIHFLWNICFSEIKQ